MKLIKSNSLIDGSERFGITHEVYYLKKINKISGSDKLTQKRSRRFVTPKWISRWVYDAILDKSAIL